MQKVLTPEFRVSFPEVFSPVSFQGGAAKYSVTMLFDKGEDLSKLKALAKAAVEAKWPDASKRPKGLRNPFRDGDEEKPDTAGYENVIFIKASSKQQPGLVDKNIQPIIEEGSFYAGCYARAMVTAYAYDRMGNRGVAFGLQNIQKLRDGESFAGKSRPEDDFKDFMDDASASTTDTVEVVQTDSMFD